MCGATVAISSSVRGRLFQRGPTPLPFPGGRAGAGALRILLGMTGAEVVEPVLADAFYSRLFFIVYYIII